MKQSESSAWAVPRAEGVTFASGSGGMRMEKGRGAAAAGQLPYLIADRLSDPSHGGHLPGNSRTREPVFGHQHPFAAYVCALHFVSRTGPVVVSLAEMAIY